MTTICFLFTCISELFHAYNLKSKTATLFGKDIFDNKVLNFAFLGSLILTVIVVVAPISPIQNAMGITSINWWQWLIALGCSILIVPYFELVKFIIRRRDARPLSREQGKKQ